jgi:hypothetical protein
MPRTRLGFTTGGVLVLLVMLAMACRGSQATKSAPANIPRFDPRDFPDSANIKNKWLPLVPGTMSVHQGQVRGIPQVVESVVTNDTKLIDGVRARAVADKDFDDGQLVEEASDYYAQDKHGNVWYMGELTTHYVNGQFTDHADTWFGGRKHAQPGIIMPANPRLGLSMYQQEFAPNIAADMGRVIKFNQSVCVPLKCYGDAMEIEETSRLDPGVIEHKYYVVGIGMIRSVVVQGDPQESNLVSVTPSS